MLTSALRNRSYGATGLSSPGLPVGIGANARALQRLRARAYPAFIWWPIVYFGHHYFVDANCGSIIEMEKYPSRLAQYAQASLIRRRRRGAVLMGV